MHRLHITADYGYADRSDYTGEGKASWYTVKADASAKSADLAILEPIGYFGVSAGEFITELNALNVDEINLAIMSPGGVAFEGVAIYNALRDHQAKVNVEVNGFAASAASLIAMAGDTITMNRGSQLMIHRSSGFAEGNRDVMAEVMHVLDAVDRVMVETYMARAGSGTEAEWYARLSATTWFSADDAVAIGLADVAVPFTDNTEDDSGSDPAGLVDVAARLDPRLGGLLTELAANGESATAHIAALTSTPNESKPPDVHPLLAQLKELGVSK